MSVGSRLVERCKAIGRVSARGITASGLKRGGGLKNPFETTASMLAFVT